MFHSCAYVVIAGDLRWDERVHYLYLYEYESPCNESACFLMQPVLPGQYWPTCFFTGQTIGPSSACASTLTGQTIVYYPTSSPLAKCPPANEAYTASNNAFRTRSAVRSDNRSFSLRVTRRYIDNHADGRLTAPSKETREKLTRDVICEQTTFFSRCLRLSPGKERSTQRRKELGYQVYWSVSRSVSPGFIWSIWLCSPPF